MAAANTLYYDQFLFPLRERQVLSMWFHFRLCLSCIVQVISRTNELVENSSEQRRKQEKTLEERQEQINKLEATMKSVSGEVIKVHAHEKLGLNVAQ